MSGKAPHHLGPPCFSSDLSQHSPHCSPSCSHMGPRYRAGMGLRAFALVLSLYLRFSHGWLLLAIQFSAQMSPSNPLFDVVSFLTPLFITSLRFLHGNHHHSVFLCICLMTLALDVGLHEDRGFVYLIPEWVPSA